jgi:hypothetical protein
MKQPDRTPAVTADTVKCDLAVQVLCSFGKLRFAATGWSMLPAIWPGETLVVERVNRDQFQGDVVLVARQGRLRAHRLVAKADGSGKAQWITQGDAIPVPDGPVTDGDLLGRVAFLIRAGRLVPVPTELSGVRRVTANIVRHSVPAARALIFAHRVIQAGEKLVSKEAIQCQS